MWFTSRVLFVLGALTPDSCTVFQVRATRCQKSAPKAHAQVLKRELEHRLTTPVKVYEMVGADLLLNALYRANSKREHLVLHSKGLC